MHRILSTCLILLSMCASASATADTPRRPLKAEDIGSILGVGAPQVSPDGKWVAYVVHRTDIGRDRGTSQLWMASWDGRQQMQLSHEGHGAWQLAWSPDGRYLSFLSSRPGAVSGTQVWVLDRNHGEARPLTEVADGVSSYAWSPDSTRLALVMRDPEAVAAQAARDGARPAKPRPPIVISRFSFKNAAGYVTEVIPSRIYLYDLATRQAVPLTDDGRFPESQPTWSPDGTRIAFVSKRRTDWERRKGSEIYVAPARPGSAPLRLTADNPDLESHGPLAWSPDSRLIAYHQLPESLPYGYSELAVVGATGTPAARRVAPALDRGTRGVPRFSRNGRQIETLVEDDLWTYPARIDLDDGRVTPLLGQVTVSAWHAGGGRTAVSLAAGDAPAEIHALEAGRLRKLTRHNDAWRDTVALGQVRPLSFVTRDGTEVHGLLTTPADYREGQRYPTLFQLHGGPHGRDDAGFSFDNQLLAAEGYAVVNVNFRGSTGRGLQFAHALSDTGSNRGDKDVMDVLAAVDHVVDLGVADPQRLGVGGWSYGAILTNYLIASDTRFKAAVSGAGISNMTALYGTDAYAVYHDAPKTGRGPPWKSLDRLVQASYPLFHADRIRTPTLFATGEQDHIVPPAGSEQMYQALSSLGVPTQLVVYPDQGHEIGLPSYRLDFHRRVLDWYRQYLAP